MTMVSKIQSLLLLCCFFNITVISAQITSGKIIYERKTNLLKKFKDPGTQRWLGEKNKSKTDLFELYFNDSVSVFRPVESTKEDELSWATNKNTVYQKLRENYRFSILNVWGESIYVQDSLRKRTWKITDSKRTIGKYECRKAIWEVNDSLRIYAWFSDQIIPSVGPETFTGLPGAILGVASEDGGIIYFAKSVEIMAPDFDKLAPKLGKSKPSTDAELRIKLEKQFGSKPELKSLIDDLFLW